MKPLPDIKKIQDHVDLRMRREFNVTRTGAWEQSGAQYTFLGPVQFRQHEAEYAGKTTRRGTQLFLARFWFADSNEVEIVVLQKVKKYRMTPA